MKNRALILLLMSAALALPACRQGGGGQPQQPAARQLRAFELPEVPAVYTDPEERRDYLLDHYWDKFLAGDGPCDTGAVLGVSHAEVEKQVATFTEVLRMLPMPQAQQYMRQFFNKVEARQAADTSSHVFLLMAEIVSRYLYDPNSPVRDEDLYLPYVQGLAASPFTREAARPGYEYESRMCALTPVGSVAPDFRFTDIRGRTHHLHEVQADATLLFFSNPGCYACLEIIRRLQEIPGIDQRIADGKLAVVNVYIDEEIDKWREYEPNYPRNWLCGYDPDGLVRSDRLYCIRAIPSLFLLDGEKRVLMKDAPVERVISWLQNQHNQ